MQKCKHQWFPVVFVQLGRGRIVRVHASSRRDRLLQWSMNTAAKLWGILTLYIVPQGHGSGFLSKKEDLSVKNWICLSKIGSVCRKLDMSIKKVEVYFSARDWICLATHGFSMKIGFLLEKWVLLTKMDSQHDFGRPKVSAPNRQSLVQECRGRNDWSGRVGPDRVATETGCERSANLIFVSKNGWLYEQIGLLCEKKNLDLSAKDWICLSKIGFVCQKWRILPEIWVFWKNDFSVKTLIVLQQFGVSDMNLSKIWFFRQKLDLPVK